MMRLFLAFDRPRTGLLSSARPRTNAMRTTALLFLILLYLSFSGIAQDAKIDVSKIPSTADQPGSFAPAGWKLEEAAKGDLNGDGSPDYAIKLVEDKPAKPDELVDSSRALVVAFSDGGK